MNRRKLLTRRHGVSGVFSSRSAGRFARTVAIARPRPMRCWQRWWMPRH